MNKKIFSFPLFFLGSTNPVKLNAVKQAIGDHWSGGQVVGIEVASGIAAQPMSDQETRLGAENRARAALKLGLIQLKNRKKVHSDNILGIGLEGGVFHHDNGELWSTVWAAVTDQSGVVYTANGARFKVPESIAQHLKAGDEMGPVVAELVGEADVRSKQGMIGIVTKNFTHRTEEYAAIIKLALGLWYGRDWDQGFKK